jgi:ABC-type antimicrobial peptide transport system permease subunit
VEPLGKKLYYPNLGAEVTVTGIVAKPTTKSSIRFDILLSVEAAQFWSSMPQSLVMLYPNVDYKDVNSRYSEFIQMKAWGYDIRYQLFPFKDVYFSENVADYNTFLHGKYSYVVIMLIVGALLLLIGTLNYLNIYTVVILRRSKEFGMKKIFGTSKGAILTQLLGENVLQIIIALIVAFGFTKLFTPLIERVFGIISIPSLHFDICLSVALVLLLALLSSILPYFRYNFSAPIRSVQAIGTMGGKAFTGKVMLGFQYFITISMIIISLLLVKQLFFMLNADLGYRSRNILQVNMFPQIRMIDKGEQARNQWQERSQKAQIIKQKLDASPLVEQWTYSELPVLEKVGMERIMFKTPDGEFKTVHLISTDEDYLKMFDIKLVDGRLWDNTTDKSFTKDSYKLLVSEAALKYFGITDWQSTELQPKERLWWSSMSEESGDMNQNPPYHIVGVFKDYSIGHLSHKTVPIVMSYSPASFSNDPLLVAYSAGKEKEVIDFLNNLHEEVGIDGEFSYSFIEDEINKVYSEDRRISMIYSTFTVIAIFVSAMGLFGLSLFDVRRRRREIAIRKVHGAEIADVIRLLLGKYLVLLGIAFFAAIPVTLYVTNRYLEAFANRTAVSWWLFAAALALTAAISLLTLLRQIWLAGRENPANVVKEN